MLIAEITPPLSTPQDRLAVWRSRGRWTRRPSPRRSSLRRRGVDGRRHADAGVEASGSGPRGAADRRRHRSVRERAKRTKSTALGPALEPIRLNYCRFFLLFSLAHAVVDPIEEGGSRSNELGPDRP